MDIIKIQNLEVFAKHGVFPEENVLGQKFIVSAELFTETIKAGSSDDLGESVNYADATVLIKKVMEENVFKLIETAAEKLAERILIEFKKIQKVKIEIKKPWAPLNIHVDFVSVVIERERKKAFIALGSNLGNKKGYLDFALNKIQECPYCSVEKVSDFIVTEPVSEFEQDDFLNGCAEIKTLFTPFELLDFLNSIENEAGRERIVHWGPRTLDLDILMYEGEVVCTERLTIPHKEMMNRRFVLEPLSQIAPFEKHPVYGFTVEKMYKMLEE